MQESAANILSEMPAFYDVYHLSFITFLYIFEFHLDASISPGRVDLIWARKVGRVKTVGRVKIWARKNSWARKKLGA